MEQCVETGDCEMALEVPEVSEEIPLDPEGSFWSGPAAPPPLKVELGPQMITNPKWPDPAVKNIHLQAVRSGSEIAIHLQWTDPNPDHRFSHSSRFTDQVAVMFPLDPGAGVPPITMGGDQAPVNLWQWKAVWETGLPGPRAGRRGRRAQPPSLEPAAPRRTSPVEDLNAEGFSTLTIQEQQDVKGKGVWKEKTWRVVMKRSLTTADENDVQFEHSLPMAVAVWDGGNKERNGQKGLFGWILLRFSG